ncbi:N,N-dimethylformamidase beta subunit family domain-containing protein, partial [Salinimicrobium marinum]|uniref:N,N-dimethylformamidase beta subunit family domain-containing protein n=1 Tax=Salinimicrobium marinum TaxID=680283 RepID=UPI001E5AFAF3
MEKTALNPGKQMFHKLTGIFSRIIGVGTIWLSLLCTFSTLGQNPVVLENSRPGNPASEWQIDGAGDRSIQGYATEISYNRGETARFKIKTNASAYSIRIYRLGYYQGLGARFQGNGAVTANLPQTQPLCITESETGLLDCGNWAESGNWQIPANAVSGIYIAKLTRQDTGGSSHITFIVRDDGSNADLFFQTSDATWQAYNVYGDNNNGKSLYTGVGGKAFKVSYNRPFVTRDGGGGGDAYEDWLFNAEYPMIRWLEANGYDVSYTTNVDSDRRGHLIRNHKVFLSVGHDEYWSATHRKNVTDARDAGIHLAFFSGNEVYWKTRWEKSIDGAESSYRTLVCYKEGMEGEYICAGKCDPTPEWTGLWRSGCEYTTGDILLDGCRPENELTGQISWDWSQAAIEVPADFKALRFWRNTSIASLEDGESVTMPFGTIGFEWNPEQVEYQSFYPKGRIILSRTEIEGKIHQVSLYRHSSGALVFGAGTVQWSWGLDSNHDRSGSPSSLNMQQATLNLLADMGVQPGSIRPELIPTTGSTDETPPVTTILLPAENSAIPVGRAFTMNGTATDEHTVAGVEISLDDGFSWVPATGSGTWSYSWTPVSEGEVNIKARSFDDSGNIGAEDTVTVTVGPSGPSECPCNVFTSGEAPTGPLWSDGSPLQVGMKFRSSENGFITGVRFYKQSGNTGVHTG